MSDLEKTILRSFYDFNEGRRSRPNHTEYDLKFRGSDRAKNEFAHYLTKLKNEEYLTFVDSKTFLPGGMRDEEYRNSIAMIFTDEVKITDKTKIMFEPKMDKVTRTAKAEGKDFVKTVNNNVKSHFAKVVSGIIILLIAYFLLQFLELF